MKNLKSNLLILLGIIITAAGISLMYVPNKIVGGGVSGISTILYHTLNIPASVSMAVLNLLLLLIGFKVLGKEFTIKTIICSGILSVFIELFSYLPPLTTDIFLATIFGAVLYGTGIGMALAFGASSGGTDILGRIIQYFLPHFPIGKILLIVDALIILTSLVIFKTINLALYGIAALYISTFAIDLLIKKLNVSKLAFVITDNGEEISKLLISTSPRGVTLIDVVGGYTLESKKMLVCALKDNELPKFQQKILSVDKEAFIIFSESQQIVGNGFYVYK